MSAEEELRDAVDGLRHFIDEGAFGLSNRKRITTVLAALEKAQADSEIVRFLNDECHVEITINKTHRRYFSMGTLRSIVGIGAEQKGTT